MAITALLFDNLLDDSSVTAVASSTATGTFVENLNDDATYDYWQSDEAGYPKITLTGSNMESDYIGLAYHNLGGIKINVYADSVFIKSFTPEDGGPIVFLLGSSYNAAFQTANQYDIEFETNDDVRIAILNIGKKLITERPCKYVGHSSIKFAKTAMINPVKAMNGQFLGARIIKTGAATNFDIENLTPEWVDSEFYPFLVHAISRPYFIAWRIDDYPNEIGYGWTNDIIVPENARSNGMKNVSWQFEGVADSDIEQLA